jgi:hypothetical protein
MDSEEIWFSHMEKIYEIGINTSNHAMAEHDANRTLWKWEYVPGVIDSPVCLGCKSREEIEAEFKPLEKSQCDCRELKRH